MTIKDSGARTEFSTGAVRDVQIGKGRCDLLPLDIIGDELKCPVFYPIYDYIHNGGPNKLWNAIELFITYQEQTKGLEPFSKVKALLAVSQHFEEGAHKYGERNWEKGIPVSRYIDSGVRHLLKVIDGWTDEPHENAFVWNMLCAVWTHHHFPELNDLPFMEETPIDRTNNRSTEPVRNRTSEYVRTVSN